MVEADIRQMLIPSIILKIILTPKILLHSPTIKPIKPPIRHPIPHSLPNNPNNILLRPKRLQPYLSQRILQ